MNSTDIQMNIKKIISELSVKDNIDDNMQMTEELGFESVAIVELITRIEEIYGIEMDSFTDLIDAFTTVGNVVNYFAGLIEEKAGNTYVDDKF